MSTTPVEEFVRVPSLDSLPQPELSASKQNLPALEDPNALILSELKIIREALAAQALELQKISVRFNDTPPLAPAVPQVPPRHVAPVAAVQAEGECMERRSSYRFSGLRGLDQVMKTRLLGLTPPRSVSFRQQSPQGSLHPRTGSASSDGLPIVRALGALSALLPGQPETVAGPMREVAEVPAQGVSRKASLRAQGLSPKAKAVQRMSRSFAPRGSASLEQVRRRVQDGIVAVAKSKTGLCEIPEDSEAGPKETLLDQLAMRLALWMDFVSAMGLRLGGILPWSRSHAWASLSYQVAVLLLHASIFVFMVAHTAGAFTPAGHVSTVLYSDLAVPFGTTVGLFIILVLHGGCQLMQCVTYLEAVAEDQDFVQVAAFFTGMDALLTLVGWLCFVGVRLAFLFMAPQGETEIFDLVYLAGLFTSSLELLLLVTIILRISRYLTSMVDAFCYRFWADMDYVNTVGNWNVLQASIRMASGSVERCFAVIQSAVLLGVLVVVWDMLSLGHDAWAGLSLLLLLGTTAQMFLQAAAVTDACTRVPQLINSTSFNDSPMDSERKYLVEYIAASEAGFYVFNVRVSFGVVVRFFHYTGLVAATIARLVISA